MTEEKPPRMIVVRFAKTMAVINLEHVTHASEREGKPNQSVLTFVSGDARDVYAPPWNEIRDFLLQLNWRGSPGTRPEQPEEPAPGSAPTGPKTGAS